MLYISVVGRIDPTNMHCTAAINFIMLVFQIFWLSFGTRANFQAEQNLHLISRLTNSIKLHSDAIPGNMGNLAQRC